MRSPVFLVHVLLLVLRALQPHLVRAETRSNSDPDYEFGDYRGKGCVDDHGFVYSIGELYYPGRAGCPCTCTPNGPVCVRPTCPRIHPRCTRIGSRRCCPVCEAMARVCIYGGQIYRVLEEFRLSRCERCRCEANREVYCSISGCPAPHCVNPVYEPSHCCPVCTSGPNCFAGNKVIPAGQRVNVDKQTVCFCTYREGSWHTHPQATCERTPTGPPVTPPQGDERGGGRRAFDPRMDVIP